MLDIFERYFLPLEMNLVPCLSGLLISILPGLDEEGSEVYDRVLRLVNNLGKRTDKQIFFRALWKSVVASPNVRCATISYLDRNIPKPGEDDEERELCLPVAETIVKGAIKACLGDTALLTQRATMEILVNHFPISSM